MSEPICASCEEPILDEKFLCIYRGIAQQNQPETWLPLHHLAPNYRLLNPDDLCYPIALDEFESRANIEGEAIGFLQVQQSEYQECMKRNLPKRFHRWITPQEKNGTEKKTTITLKDELQRAVADRSKNREVNKTTTTLVRTIESVWCRIYQKGKMLTEKVPYSDTAIYRPLLGRIKIGSGETWQEATLRHLQNQIGSLFHRWSLDDLLEKITAHNQVSIYRYSLAFPGLLTHYGYHDVHITLDKKTKGGSNDRRKRS